VLDRLDTSLLSAQAKEAIRNLKAVYQILVDYGYEDYISIDLSLVQGINRYTGIIFKGITHGIGYSICAGGRYDGLTGEFGADLPAVGMAIGTDRLLTVLSRQNCLEPVFGSDFLVVCKDSKLAQSVLSSLRESGYVAERALTDDDAEALRAYAEKNNIQGILTVKDAHHAEIYNVELCETTAANLHELFEHDEDCHCDHCEGGDED